MSFFLRFFAWVLNFPFGISGKGKVKGKDGGGGL